MLWGSIMANTYISVELNGEVLQFLIKRLTKKFVIFEYHGDEIICPFVWG